MSDPTELGFRQPLESSPIDLENWDDGATQTDIDGVMMRRWYNSQGDTLFVVRYDENFDEIALEKWDREEGTLESVPVNATIEGHDRESDDFLQLVEGFFDLIGPQINR